MPRSPLAYLADIVDFRDQLALDCAAVSDAVVWALTADQVPVLRQECECIPAVRTDRREAD